MEIRRCCGVFPRVHRDMDLFGEFVRQITCPKCGLSTHLFGYGKCTELAIKNWNAKLNLYVYKPGVE